MDETCIPFVELGALGCNYCVDSRARARANIGEQALEQTVQEIKSTSRGKFDCVVGVSGGLDSSYLVCRLVELGLRPIAVHMDNNWNSSMASSNLRRILGKLGVPLITKVTDWQTQKRLQLAFLEADVVDVELLYDNALHSICYEVAKEFGIKTIVGGSNNATEGVEIPSSWGWKKFDGKNIRSIAKASRVSYRGYPIFSSSQWLYCTIVLGIKWKSLLDQMPEYNRDYALKYLQKNFGYTDYGNKHYENVFTRFYQGYILPEKFGIDKRKPHLSSEIVSGAITRKKALSYLAAPIYTSSDLLELDFRYVSQKLGLTREEMLAYIERPARSHEQFSYDKTIKYLIPLLLQARRLLLQFLRSK